MQDGTLGRVLYYPNFSPDVNWLKCSLLYWDEVSRIVPEDAKWELQYDDPDECRLAQDEGLLVPVDPENYRNDAGAVFENHLTPLLDRRRSSHKEWVAEVKKGFNYEVRQSKLANWLRENSGSERRKRLVDLGFLSHEGDWASMPGLVAGMYMTCLATTMSQRTHMDLMTDKHLLMEASESLMYTEGAPTNEPNDSKQVIGRLGVRFPSPGNLEDVPMKKVVAFAKTYADERRLFRDTLTAFRKRLAEAEDEYHIEGIFNDEKKNVNKSRLTLRKLFTELGVPAIKSVLYISVPAMFGNEAVKSVGVDATALTASAVFFSLAAAVQTANKDWAKLIAERPWHYAWRVQDRFWR